jgi:L-lactate utilization protein LutB
MKGKTLAEFLNAVMQHEVGHFAFANTEQEAGQIILSIIEAKQKKKEKYN